MQLNLADVINISVSQTPTGLSAYNTSNLALFTADSPGAGFGTAGYKIYLDPGTVAVDFGSSSNTALMATAVFSQQPNILAGGGYLVVIPFLTSETLAAAITRTTSLVQYFGAMAAAIEIQADVLAAGAVAQALNKVIFIVEKTSASIAVGGTLDLLRSGTLTHTRGLYYGSTADIDALVMQAAYAGRALSTNFSGSNTTQTMHLKDLAGVQPDPSMTESLFALAQAAGADVYAGVQNVPKVLCSGANAFFDQVYNLGWFIGALQVAGFNYLAQASTKIPQTESGMDGLKGAYRAVCQQAASNQYIAPGSWTSPSIFGVQADLLNNVAERGYYIYSAPISQQLQVDRVARKAPLIQIAVKEAGAFHSSSVIVNVNA